VGYSRAIVTDRRARDEFFTVSREMTPLIGLDCGDMRFVIPTDDTNLGRQFFTKNGRGEMSAVMRAGATLRKRGALRGSTLIDVGANIGTTTITALVAGKLQRAVAIEPAAGNLRLLRANLALNDLLDRVTVLEAAAADSDGEAHLQLHDENIGAHYVADDGVPVRALALDSLDLVPDEIALLWMDVQGYEGHVLAGAQRLVHAGVPFVVEFQPGKLRKAGHWDALCAAFERYETVIDLRVRSYEPIPAGEAIDRVERMLDERGRPFTDLLVFRPR
jgi:FkbM family methyltransferase